MTTPHIPARFDHVGSFLRPAYLLEAREQKAKGQITPEQLRAVEDKAITEIVQVPRRRGPQSPSPTASSAAPISTSTFWSKWAA
jgi:5-methyltetrahydropteroyltriglutamate--homocysteine methyltransferase